MNKSSGKLLRPFKPPEPVREVSLVTHRDFIKKRLIEALKDDIAIDSLRDKGKNPQECSGL